MQVFRAYLRKEWCEQRLVIVALAIGLFVATGLIGLVLEWETMELSFTYDWVVSMCAGAALLTVGSDLFARERHRGQLQFLERVPAGLSAAFHGKLAFFALVLIGSVLYGCLLAALSGLVFAGSFPLADFAGRGTLIAALSVAALWVFAVSTWVPTSVTSVPLTALFVALNLLPAHLFLRFAGGLDSPFGSPWPLLGTTAVGALLSARVCFVNAAARSRPRRTAIWSCAGIGVLAFLPYNVWAGATYIDWLNWPYRVNTVFVGNEARYAFFNLSRLDPQHRGRHTDRPRALVLDLQTLDWQFEGGEGASAFTDHDWSSPGFQRPDQNLFTLYSSQSGEARDVYDASTGERLRTFSESERTPFLPYSPEDFGLEQFAQEPRFSWAGAGQQVRFRDADEKHAYIRTPDGSQVLRIERYRAGRVRALRDGFVIHEQDGWQWIDPETLTLTPFEPLKPDDKWMVTLTDGSLVVITDGELVLLDPRTGDRESVELKGPGRERGSILSFLTMHSLGSRGPLAHDGTSVVQLYLEGTPGRYEPALLDLAERTLTLADWDTGVIGVSSLSWNERERAIAVEDFRVLVHYDFGSGERRVLFDVANLER